MPYIEQERRDALIGTLRDATPIVAVLSPGELNYLVTNLVNCWLGTHANYSRYNAALGVLEAVKQELYRRQIAPYEDEKCEKNGDVY